MSSSIFVRVHEWARWFEPPQGLRTSGFREHFECADPQCEVTAYNAGAVSTHFACVHKFGCPFCGVNFIAQRFLDNHLVVVHASFFPCPMGELQITHWDTDVDGVFSVECLTRKLEKEGFRVESYIFPPGTVFGEHTHCVDKKDAITSGKFAFTMYGKTVVLTVGDAVFVPKNTVHAARVVGNEPVGFLDASRY